MADIMKKSLPALDPDKMVNYSPSVVILGAGASRASCISGDKYNQIVPLMNELIDILNLRNNLKDLSLESDINDFESIYDELATKKSNPEILSEIEARTYDYFNRLYLPDNPTIYDYLVLSLRKKDLIATFNWDPFLFQAYRRNSIVGHMPNILFLHGNVKVGVCNKHKSKGFVDQLCKNCGTTYSPTKLLYPVKHKNYNLDPFIAQEWEILQKYLKIAYEVTIFGYGSPQTDIEAKNLMLEVWKNNPTRELANISIIDIKTRESIEELWHPYIDNLHNNIFNNIFDSHLFHFPRRSCDALAMATLELDPWHENKYPNFTSLEQLKRWILPLIEEEKHDKFSGNPLERP